jgi:hypothetical protein
MDVIYTNRTFEDVYFLGGADLSYDISKSVAYFILKDLFAVFGTPDNVIFVVIGCMSGAIVACHIPKVY